MNWMIYGATGFTGRLTAEEAVRQNLSPVLAGRSEAKVRALAERLGLRHRAFGLDSLDTIVTVLQEEQIELVLHVAGPFIHTSDVMIRACLAAGAHYLDITGEIPVYQNARRYDREAQEKQIAIMPGVGFDVVPSDCLMKYVADQVEDATHLEVAFLAGDMATSRGTMKSGVEMVRTVGNVIRENGQLKKVPFGSKARIVRFTNGTARVVQSVWGDVETAYHTTGVPNIITYFAFAPDRERQLRLLGRAAPLLNIDLVRNAVLRQIDRMPEGPTEHQQQTSRMGLYARAANGCSPGAEAWLETCEGYRFTALTSLRAALRVMNGSFAGALTPAGAFGADFVLEIEGTQRFDQLPD